MRKIFTTIFIVTILQLNGCAFLLVGAGVGAAIQVNDAKNKQIELEAKKEYGQYRQKMQQTNSDLILTYEEWLKEQMNDPEKAKKWKNVLADIERQNNKR